jgi:hypothetical protein
MSQPPILPATPENIAAIASKPDDPKTQPERFAKISDLIANKDKRYYMDIPGIGKIEWKRLTVNDTTDIQKACAKFNQKTRTIDMDSKLGMKMVLMRSVTNPTLSEENFTPGHPNELDGVIATLIYEEIEKSRFQNVILPKK